MLVKVYNTRHASFDEVREKHLEFVDIDVPRMGESVELPDLRSGTVVKVNWVLCGNGRRYVEVFVRLSEG